MNFVGFDPDLLAGWYQAQGAAQRAGLKPQPSGASSGQFNTNKTEIMPPWDVRGGISPLADVARRVLANGVSFDAKLREFSRLDAPGDHKALFALHQGLRQLYSLASEAAALKRGEMLSPIHERRFTEGLSALDDFLGKLKLEELTLLKGEKLSRAESEVAISRGLSEYPTGVVHTGAFDAEVDNFLGDVRFTISVRKMGVDTPIHIDLADMGATPRTLDNVTAHINAALEDAEMMTRIERVKIGTPDSNGIVPGDDWGFKIKGVLTETLSFSAPDAQPAVYLAGVSGTGDGAAGQIFKLTDVLSGDPQTAFTRRLEADAAVISTTNDKGETKTSTEVNPLKIHASAASADGSLYVVGETGAGVDGQQIKGETDLVLSKYDSTGKLVWTRVLGASESASGAAVAVDAQGNVVVAGTVKGAMGGTHDIGGDDSLVVKYSAAGVEQWAQRFGGTGDDRANAVTIAADGTIYVAGEASTAFGGQGHQGGAWDGYVRAISASGEALYTRRVGDTGNERALATAVAADGGLLVVSAEDGRAVLRKFDAGDGEGAALWSLDLGSLDGGRIGAITVGDDGAIYVAGSAGAGFVAENAVNGHSGGRDAVLIRIGDGASPAVAWTAFLGSDADDAARSVAVHDGKVYVAGNTTGDLPGQTLNGTRNGFAAQFDAASGALDWTVQTGGRGGHSDAAAIVVDPGGDSVLGKLGLPSGTVAYADTRVVTDRTSVRAGDSFFVSVNGGRKRQIVIGPNDTLRSLTFKINAVLLFDGSADVRRTADGDILRISPKTNVTIDLSAGPEGRDALAGLGLVPGAVTKTPSALDKNADRSAAAPPVYALGLPSSLSLSSPERAKAAMKALEDAMSAIQRAYRELTQDPALKSLLEGPQGKRGPVPSYLTAQLANYQAGLERLNAGPAAGGFGGLFL
ncbi:MAG: hypothetical protein KIS81_04035 [Maricaulaceae bacterium]|nr:hypothetical protein [Maricaulaceae bacterium]